MRTKDILRQTLIKNSIAVDNQYLDRYCLLIQNNINTKQVKFKTQQHHIIPKYYFRAHDLPIDNTSQNLVNLKHSDHILAHYYLALCSAQTEYRTATYKG